MRSVALALFLLLAPALAQGVGEDPWAFVDQVVAPYRDPKTGFVEKRAIPCQGRGLGELVANCLYSRFGNAGILRSGFGPGTPDPQYRGESFQRRGDDSLLLLASLPSREAAERFLQSLSWDGFHSPYLDLRSAVWRLEVEVLFPEEEGVSREICSLAPPGVAVKLYPKAEAPLLRDGILVVLVRSPERGARASFVAFGGTPARGFAWRGFYGEPFTRGVATSLERMLRRGAQPLCSSGR